VEYPKLGGQERERKPSRRASGELSFRRLEPACAEKAARGAAANMGRDGALKE